MHPCTRLCNPLVPPCTPPCTPLVYLRTPLSKPCNLLNLRSNLCTTYSSPYTSLLSPFYFSPPFHFIVLLKTPKTSHHINVPTFNIKPITYKLIFAFFQSSSPKVQTFLLERLPKPSLHLHLLCSYILSRHQCSVV